MPITFACTDNGDGSGATAIVAGSSPGSLNTIQVMRPFDAGWTTTTIANVGDGIVQLPLQSAGGPLSVSDVWYVRSQNISGGVTTYTGSVLVNPTQGQYSPWFACMCQIQINILGLNLPAIGGKVYRGDDPDALYESVTTFPAVLVTIPPEAERVSPTDNQASKWIFPIIVIVVDNKQDVLTVPENRLHWRWRIMAAFNRLTPLGTAAYRTAIEPAAYQPKDPTKYERWQTAVRVLCEVQYKIGATQ